MCKTLFFFTFIFFQYVSWIFEELPGQHVQVIAEVSEDLGEAMTGINCDGLVTRFADREGGNMPAAKKPRMESYGDKGLAGTAF